MNHDQMFEILFDYIDQHITEKISVEKLRRIAGYSPYYFSRMFRERIGISAISYLTWRKLQYALYDLSQGEKVIDVAMKYGFEKHGGFTKAFVRWFGFPPVLCHFRLEICPPKKITVAMLQTKFGGGNTMNPHIFEFSPFSVVGYPSRHTKAQVKSTADIPTFWNTIHLNYGPLLIKLHDTFTKSKHFEISLCYDVDENTGEFTYLLGRGIDHPEDLKNIQPDMTRIDIAGGLYAVFSTPPTADSYIEAAQETWNEIFLNWLPQSEFEFDETRYDFEYHDFRDHGYYFDGKLQIDICIPIRQKAEEKRKSQLRMNRE